MDGIELESELIGKVFLKLIEPPLEEMQLMALNPLERALYVVCKFKLGKWTDDGFTSYLNQNGQIHYSGQATEILASVLDHKVGLPARMQILRELYHGEWLTKDRSFAKADNVTELLVALTIYREGGWVKYDGRYYHGPSPAR